MPRCNIDMIKDDFAWDNNDISQSRLDICRFPNIEFSNY